jgi:Flp pilus assembly protein TadG
MKRKTIHNQRGAFLVICAISLVVLLGFVALGMEVGQWYLVRAELSKAVDSAALSAAKNISNPYADAGTLAVEFGNANFEAGFLGTPGSGPGSVNLSPTIDTSTGKVTVTGIVSAKGALTRLFGIDTVPVAATGAAQRKDVEIMLVLDRSGSMSGTKIADLKTAANKFIDYFSATQDRDKVGLVSYAMTVTLDQNLGTNFVTSIKAKISNLSAAGGTNMAEALARVTGTNGFTDQTGVPGDQRIQQFVVFFTDGLPTAYRDTFKYNGNTFDAVATVPGNCPIPPNTSYPDVYPQLASTTTENTFLPTPPHPYPAGNGSTTLTCRSSLQSNNYYRTTMWNRFTTVPPVSPYTTGQCVNDSVLGKYVCTQARQMTSNSAQSLKDKYIKVYTIGLGSTGQIDPSYLQSLSSDCNNGVCSGANFSYIAPSSSDLQAIFNKIAKDIKLRLVY